MLVSTNPSGGAATWRTYSVYRNGGSNGYFFGPSSVSCPSASLCVAFGLYGGTVATTTDPTAGPSAWTPVSGLFLSGISCPSFSLCVGGGARSNSNDVLATSTNPTGGSSAWTTSPLEPGPGPNSEGTKFNAVSCGSPSQCVALETLETNCSYYHGQPLSCDDTAEISQSTDPPGGGQTWSTVGIGQGSFAAAGISCASSSLCVVASGATVITSTDPSGGADAWTPSRPNVGNGLLGAISCPSPSLCAAAGDNQVAPNLVTSTNPTGGATAWTPATLLEPGSPAVQRLALTGLPVREPKLAFTVRAGAEAPGIASFTIAPPAGLRFASERSKLMRGVRVSRGEPVTITVGGRALQVRIGHVVRALTVTVTGPAILESSALARTAAAAAIASVNRSRPVGKEKILRLQGKLTIADAQGKPTRVRLSIQVR